MRAQRLCGADGACKQLPFSALAPGRRLARGGLFGGVPTLFGQLLADGGEVLQGMSFHGNDSRGCTPPVHEALSVWRGTLFVG
jgi:hypothetical protein